jgi:type III pantothenate kinase
MMLFCVNIGNTNIALGLYEGEEMAAQWRICSDLHRLTDEYAMLVLDLFERAGQDPTAVQGVVISSVVPPLTGVFEQLSERYLGLKPLVVDTEVHTGVRIRLDNPKEVGADRVVNVVAAYRRYGGPACVVDLGTGTTFDLISVDGDYLGGAIAPGLGIAADALYQRTAKLPRIDLVRPPSAIGKNTVHAMQSGLIFGYAGLVEGMVARYRAELGPEMKVIATGGIAPLMAAETSVFDAVDPWLTLDGLRMVWEMNNSPDRPG